MCATVFELMAVEPIHLEQTFQIRSRPDVLFRLVADPKRRIRWDKNLRVFQYVGEEKLERGARVKLRLITRLGGLVMYARYSQLSAPNRFTLESEKPGGFIARFEQSWIFKPVPGGSEVTSKFTVLPRYKFGRKMIERLVHSLVGETLLGLQRQVDSQMANLMEEMSKEMAEKQKREKRQKKKK